MKDVAWGFFFTSDTGAGRCLASEPTKREAVRWHARFKPAHKTSAVFKIVGPKAKGNKK